MSAVSRDDWSAYDRAAVSGSALYREGTLATAQLTVGGMHCGACALKIERALKSIDGVSRVAVNGATKRMQLSWDVTRVRFSRLLGAIADLGFRPEVLGASRGDSDVAERRTALKRLAVAGFAMAQVMGFAFALYIGAAQDIEPRFERYLRLVSMLVTVPVVLYSARPFYAGAWRDLSSGRLGMDTPVSLAIGLAFLASSFNTFRDSGEVYFDSVTMFVFFLLLARWVEMQTRHRSVEVSEALGRLLPESVQRVRDTQLETIGIAELQVGDQVQVPAGGLVPADGIVREGTSHTDESLLTGESTPLLRKRGSRVLGGSLNVGNPLRIEITDIGSNTVLAGIVRLLERAQTERPRLGRAADRAAAWFVGGVLLLAVAVAAFWLYAEPGRAFSAALAVLVVTCPCALSLATPVAIAAATTRLAKIGLLVTHADAVEALAHVRHCIFDKTGTLTQGTPRLTRANRLGSRSIDECLAIASALERGSEHPLASAFTTAHALQAKEIHIARGFGLEGTVDGVRYRIGRLDFVRRADAVSGATHADGDVFLADDSGLLAAFTIDDALRPEAAGAVNALQALGIEVQIASGDHRAAVERIARHLGIVRWYARLTPEAKLTQIRKLNDDAGGVVMVGDGINDAPVLGAAKVSVAMGSGSALAHASADSILMSPSLTVIADSVLVARRALRIVHQNLWWAAAYNLLAVPAAAAGSVPPWAAAIGMSLSSIVVVLNAGRLSRPAKSAGEKPVLLERPA